MSKLKNIEMSHLKNYLQNQGWKKVDHPNTRVICMQSPEDVDGNTIEIVLPTEKEALDSELLITKTITTLSELQEKDSTEIIDEILNAEVIVS